MSLSQFMYSLAGMEDQIAENDLPTARSSEVDSLAVNGVSRLTEKAGEQISAIEPSPLSPNSFVGYLFGGGGSPAPVVEKKMDETVVQEEEEGLRTFLWDMVSGTAAQGEDKRAADTPKLETPLVAPKDAGKVESVIRQPAVSVPVVTAPSSMKATSTAPTIPQQVTTVVPAVSTPTTQPRNVLDALAKQLDTADPATVNQAAYRAKGVTIEDQKKFTDSDAESVVDQVEEGRPVRRRRLLPSDEEMKMKLGEAKAAVKKLKSLQEETNKLLGILPKPTETVVAPGPKESKDHPQTATQQASPEIKPSLPVSSASAYSKEILQKSEEVLNQSRVQLAQSESRGNEEKRVKVSSHPVHAEKQKRVPHTAAVKYFKQTYDSPYRAKHAVFSVPVPISDRIKSFPSSSQILHANSVIPYANSGPFARTPIVVSSVECTRRR